MPSLLGCSGGKQLRSRQDLVHPAADVREDAWQPGPAIDAPPDASPAVGLTVTGAVLGSPGYLAPEQLAGGGVDVRSDLFSLGAVLYEMLAGRPAFPGASVAERIEASGRSPEDLATAVAVLADLLHHHPSEGS